MRDAQGDYVVKISSSTYGIYYNDKFYGEHVKSTCLTISGTSMPRTPLW